MNDYKCVKKVYCQHCEYYQAPGIYDHYSVMSHACRKYTMHTDYPTHCSTRKGDVSELNANNNCQGFRKIEPKPKPKPKPKPGSYEVVADDPAVAMSIGKALLISAFIMTMGAVGAAWLL